MEVLVLRKRCYAVVDTVWVLVDCSLAKALFGADKLIRMHASPFVVFNISSL